MRVDSGIDLGVDLGVCEVLKNGKYHLDLDLVGESFFRVVALEIAEWVDNVSDMALGD